MADGVTPELADVLQRAFDARVAEICTSIPGVVLSYDSATQTAEVQPVIKRALFTADDDLVHEDLPAISNVKVKFPRGGPGGQFAITWPLVAGDHVLLVFSMYAIAQWRRSGQVSEPGDLRQHHLSNPIAIPGIAPDSDPIDPAQAGANAMVIEGPEIRLGKDATNFVALENLVATELGKIKDALTNLSCAAAPGPVVSSTPYSSVGSVAATKAKAK